MKRLRQYFFVALVFWAVIAVYGLILRWHLVKPLPINYFNWLNAHSHAAFLGWLHAALAVLLAYVFFPAFSEGKTFRRLYWFSQLTVAGLLISFPVQGYKTFSIIFLSLFLLGTYVFAWIYLKKSENAERFPGAYRLGKNAVFFLVLSSVSPWMLGPTMVMLGKQSIWYNLDIYFYLHFQYNGWFFLALLALLVYLFEWKGFVFPVRKIKLISNLLFWGILFGYITNTLWTQPPLVFNIVAMISVFAEGAGLWLLYRELNPEASRIFDRPFDKTLWKLIWLAIGVKIILQFMASCPYFARVTYHTRDLIIGYLHWVMLGLFSTGILFVARRVKMMYLDKKSFILFYAGMLLMEFFIFLRGTAIWRKWNLDWPFPLLIFLATFVMFIGIVFIVVLWKKEPTDT